MVQQEAAASSKNEKVDFTVHAYLGEKRSWICTLRAVFAEAACVAFTGIFVGNC
jgi:hypothetical protein